MVFPLLPGSSELNLCPACVYKYCLHILLIFALFSSELFEVQIYSKFDSKVFGSMFWTNWGSPSEQVRRHASRYLHIPMNTCAHTHKHTGTHVIKCFWVPHRNPSKATPRGSMSMAATDTWVLWMRKEDRGRAVLLQSIVVQLLGASLPQPWRCSGPQYNKMMPLSFAQILWT